MMRVQLLAVCCISRDPNRPLSVPVQWPRYDDHYKRYLELTTRLSRKSVKSRANEKKYYFWNQVIPSVTSGRDDVCAPRDQGTCRLPLPVSPAGDASNSLGDKVKLQVGPALSEHG